MSKYTRTYLFKLTFEDGDFCVYSLKDYKQEILKRYAVGRRVYIGDRSDGVSMISVTKVIKKIEFLPKNAVKGVDY